MLSNSQREDHGGNRKAAAHHNVDESLVRDWRKNKTKLARLATEKGSKTKNLERKRLPGAGSRPLLNEITIVQKIKEYRGQERKVFCKMIRLWAREAASEAGVEDFKASRG